MGSFFGDLGVWLVAVIGQLTFLIGGVLWSRSGWLRPWGHAAYQVGTF